MSNSSPLLFSNRPSSLTGSRKRQQYQPTHNIQRRPSHCPKPMRRNSTEVAALAKRITRALPAMLALETRFGSVRLISWTLLYAAKRRRVEGIFRTPTQMAICSRNAWLFGKGLLLQWRNRCRIRRFTRSSHHGDGCGREAFRDAPLPSTTTMRLISVPGFIC